MALNPSWGLEATSRVFLHPGHFDACPRRVRGWRLASVRIVITKWLISTASDGEFCPGRRRASARRRSGDPRPSLERDGGSVVPIRDTDRPLAPGTPPSAVAWESIARCGVSSPCCNHSSRP